MELNIWFEQDTKHVSGVTDKTSCHDLIMAIAQSVGMTGCYSLSLRLPAPGGGMDEMILAPNDRPLTLLSRKKLHPQAVQFILRRRAADNNPTSDTESLTHKNAALNAPKTEDDNLHKKWKDQLSYQEQEIEFNRVQLLKLEKELAHLEKQCRLADPPKLQQEVQEQREELFTLQRADLPRILAEEKQRSTDLQLQWNQIQEEIKHLEVTGKQTKEKITILEQKVSMAMEQCLNTLRDSNLQLQEEVIHLEKGLVAAQQRPRPTPTAAATAAQGAPNNSYWV